jgi:hypothetical protein
MNAAEPMIMPDATKFAAQFIHVTEEQYGEWCELIEKTKSVEAVYPWMKDPEVSIPSEIEVAEQIQLLGRYNELRGRADGLGREVKRNFVDYVNALNKHADTLIRFGKVVPSVEMLSLVDSMVRTLLPTVPTVSARNTLAAKVNQIYGLFEVKNPGAIMQAAERGLTLRLELEE